MDSEWQDKARDTSVQGPPIFHKGIDLQEYRILAEVNRNVTDSVSIVVEASTFAEAREKASKVLEIFPAAHDVQGVPYCRVYKRTINHSEVESLDEQTTK